MTTNSEQNTRTPIGYKTYASKAQEIKQLPSINKEQINLYLQAVITAFNQFLEEEVNQNNFSENRLKSKIESARFLFPNAYSNLPKIDCYDR